MVLLAYLIRDWSQLQLSFAISSLGLVSIYFLVPESPRWLLSQGHFEQVLIAFVKFWVKSDFKTNLEWLYIHITYLWDSNKHIKLYLDLGPVCGITNMCLYVIYTQRKSMANLVYFLNIKFKKHHKSTFLGSACNKNW